MSTKFTYWQEDEDKLLLELVDQSGKVPIEVFRDILFEFNEYAATERSAGALQNRHRLLQKKQMQQQNDENMEIESNEYRKRKRNECHSPLSPVQINKKRRKIVSDSNKYIFDKSGQQLDWKENAHKIINILWNDVKSEPFRQKVDEVLDEAPNYYQVIRCPMDLGTLKKEIKNLDLMDFFHKLLLIWTNAQKYNSAQFEIHRHAVQLQAKSLKLLKEVWPKQYEEFNQTNRRKSRRIRKEFAYRNQDDLMCGICNKSMKFCVGFDVNCNDNIQCNECKNICDDAKISYYHCGECNVSLCGMCWHKFDSGTIVLKEGDTRQIAFRGLFCEYARVNKRINEDEYSETEWRPWFEAMMVECYSNKMFYRLVYSTENDKKYLTEARINMNETEMKFEKVEKEKNGLFDEGYLSSNGFELIFIDNENPFDIESTAKYKKCREFCQKCGEEMLFLTKGMLPTNDDCSSKIYCDVHDEIYEKMKALPENERCASFQCVKECANDDEIYQNEFYFSCIHCNDFDQCNLCTLIKNELLLTQQFEQQCIQEEEEEAEELECKESSIENMKKIKEKQSSEIGQIDQLKRELAEEKIKVCQLGTELRLNELQREQMKTNYSEVYNELQSVKDENDKLNEQNVVLTKDRDEWKDKYLISNGEYMNLKKTLSNLIG